MMNNFLDNYNFSNYVDCDLIIPNYVKFMDDVIEDLINVYREIGKESLRSL